MHQIGLHRPSRFDCGRAACSLAMLAALLAGTSGCNAFGNRKVVQQLQAENERLISEFRAQRDSNELLRKQNQQLENRVAESEKLLARTYQDGGSRISSLLNRDASGSSPLSYPSPNSPSRASGSFPSSDAAAAGGLQWKAR